MKTTIQRTLLLSALTQALPFVSTRTTLPILACVLLAARDGELTLTVTDLDNTLEFRIAADVSEPGTVCIPALTLRKAVAAMKDGTIALDGIAPRHGAPCDGFLRGEGTTIMLAGHDPDSFPLFPKPAEQSVPMDFADLCRRLRATQRFLSTDETRYMLLGFHFHVADESLMTVTTDGRRLMRIAVVP